MTQVFESGLGIKLPESSNLKVLLYIKEDPSSYIPIADELTVIGYNPRYDAYLHRFYVPPELRGNNDTFPFLSHTILDSIEAKCQRAGVRTLWSVVLPDSPDDLTAILKFYRKRGYELGSLVTEQAGTLFVVWRDFD